VQLEPLLQQSGIAELHRVSRLAVLAEIESLFFVLVADAESGDRFDNAEQDIAQDEGIDDCGEHADRPFAEQ
jgi:hypothetical protein